VGVRPLTDCTWFIGKTPSPRTKPSFDRTRHCSACGFETFPGVTGNPVPKICGCRSKFWVPLSITSQVPFVYLRLRKKLESSYSAIRLKTTGNRNYWADSLPKARNRAIRDSPRHPSAPGMFASRAPLGVNHRSGNCLPIGTCASLPRLRRPTPLRRAATRALRQARHGFGMDPRSFRGMSQRRAGRPRGSRPRDHAARGR